ncbi:MAG TPA: RidA family protein [Gemmatimonadales bacterium]|jgi:reactive intermediate/imine deaminase
MSRAPVEVEFFPFPAGSRLPFSEAVRVGNLLHLSGQMGIDEHARLVPGGMVAEARQIMHNIDAVLRRHGLISADVVKCTVMLADMSEWSAFNQVYLEYFAAPLPARSAFGANGLALGGRVEVECVAVFR